MEIIDRDNNGRSGKGITLAARRNIFLGATFIAVGIVWLLYNFDVVDAPAFDIIFSWRSLLVVVGAFLLTQERKTSGIIITSIGLVALALELLHICIPEDVFVKALFPVIFIIVGVVILLSKVVCKAKS